MPPLSFFEPLQADGFFRHMVKDVKGLLSPVLVFRQHVGVLLEQVCRNKAVLLA